MSIGESPVAREGRVESGRVGFLNQGIFHRIYFLKSTILVNYGQLEPKWRTEGLEIDWMEISSMLRDQLILEATTP